MTVLIGDDDDDILVGGGAADSIVGKGGDDRLFGRGGNDTLRGGTGIDTLSGGLGSDSLAGRAGDDRLFGGDGKDTLVGGLGRDFLNGGTGADTFRFDDKDAPGGGRSDVILDLGKGDIIDLMALDVTYFESNTAAELEPGGLTLLRGDDDNLHIVWNTHGAVHDIEIRGDVDYWDVLQDHMRWYVDDHTGGSGSGPFLGGNETRIGKIETTADFDYFRLKMQADKLYTIRLDGAPKAANPLDWFELSAVDQHGDLVIFRQGAADFPVEVRFHAEKAETLFLGVSNNYSAEVGAYTLTIESARYVDDYGSLGDADAGKLVAGTSTSGKIGHDYDDDAFTFRVEKGETYRIDVSGASTGGGTLEDPVFSVYDSRGNSIAGGGFGEPAEFTAEEDATYTVVVEDLVWSSNDPPDTGRYRISLTEGDPLLA